MPQDPFQPFRQNMADYQRNALTKFNAGLAADQNQRRNRIEQQDNQRQNRLMDLRERGFQLDEQEAQQRQALEAMKVVGPLAKSVLENPQAYPQARLQYMQMFPGEQLPESFEEALPQIQQAAQLYDQLQGTQKQPSSVAEWEYFSKLSQEQQQRYLTMKRAEKTIDLGDRVIQTTPGQPGQTAAEYPKGLPPQQEPALKGEQKEAEQQATAKVKKETGFPKQKAKIQSLNRQWDVVDSKISEAITKISPFTAGVGSWLSVIPGTPQKDLKETLNTIRANIGFDKLQDMRANSPTGGALGQVSEMENRLLQAVQGSVDQAQSPAQLAENLKTIQQLLRELKNQTNEAYQTDYAEMLGTTGQPEVAPTVQQPTGSPPPGTVEDGYRFKGGNPADPNSWEKM